MDFGREEAPAVDVENAMSDVGATGPARVDARSQVGGSVWWFEWREGERERGRARESAREREW